MEKNSNIIIWNKNRKFKFNQDPFFIKYFKIGKGINSEKEKHVNIYHIKHSFKLGGYSVNKIFASFWFGAFLFAMQSYFLRQNLKLTDVKFISD